MSTRSTAAEKLRGQWGKNVKRRREAQRWTQTEFGGLVGVDQSTISRLESGDLNNISTELMIRIGLAFGEDPGTIFDWPLGILAMAAREVA